MSEQRVIALLGRRDEPTDAVEEYCQHLGEALSEHDFKCEMRRVPWNQHGWAASLDALRLQAESWRGVWVLVQYTALAWSARGFPRRFMRVLRVLRKAGARVAVVFHDAQPFGGSRFIDRLRRAAQIRAMSQAVALADRAIVTVPLERVAWLKNAPAKASFIVVGANLPQPLMPQNHESFHEPPCIAVFGITGDAAGEREVGDILGAVRLAVPQVGKLRLLVFGRNADQRGNELREGLQSLPVELAVHGVLDGQQLLDCFAASDMLLFVRGSISSRRGSAIAGISCGLPVIGLEGPETASPITDAGVVLISQDQAGAALQLALAESIKRILRDHKFRAELIARNEKAHGDHFSWPAIARRYVELLR